MRLDGVGLLVENMSTMIRFYRDVLGFEITEGENAENVYLIKDETLFMLYERKNFEKMTGRKYEYLKGLNGHFEIALYVDTFEEVDREYARILAQGGRSVLEPTTEPGDSVPATLRTRREISSRSGLLTAPMSEGRISAGSKEYRKWKAPDCFFTVWRFCVFTSSGLPYTRPASLPPGRPWG